MADPIDPVTLPCLHVCYAPGGECIVLDHHAGEIEVRDPGDIATEGTAFTPGADYTSRGLVEPTVIPQLPEEPA